MILPTSVVGSHGLPGWVWLARQAITEGRLGAADIKELMEDATQIALADQERAGVDVVSTGEIARVDFIVGFYGRLAGVRALPATRKLGPPHWDTESPFEVTDRVTAPDGLGVVEEFTIARRLTGKPMKATVPGPYTLGNPLRPGGPYRDRDTLLADLTAIVNAELRALAEAGADFIQLDEPSYGMHRRGLPDLAEVFNKAVEGVKAKIALHICFGNLNGRPFPAMRSYRHLFPAIHAAKAQQIVLEFANRGLEDAGLWKEFPTAKELGAGVIDVKAFRAETAEAVAARIRTLLDAVPADKLWINPDCGFWATPRWVTVAKLRAMVEGTRLVRKELGG
jgi:5-methyltetrahydropteroyltriglutamate--homocysteine methyltransferase